MSNTLVTTSLVLREVAYSFINNLRFAANCERKYSDQFAQNGAKVGDSVKVRLPQRYEVKDGAAIQQQDLTDRTVSIQLSSQKHIAFSASSVEQTLDLEDFKARYVEPAGQRLANAFDVQTFEDVYRPVFNTVGTIGTTPTSNLTYLSAVQKIVDQGGPVDGLVAVIPPKFMTYIANANLSLFHPKETITQAFKKGLMATDALGISEWYQSQNCPAFTTGANTGASTPKVNGATQTGATLTSDGWGSGTTSLKKGDIIKVAGVNSVNPVTGVDTGELAQFTLTADISDTTGAIVLPISPSIITSGALKTVTGSPADNAVITYWSMADGGTQAATVSKVGMVYHPSAFAAVMADLAKPAGGAEVAVLRAKEMNVALRWAQDWSIESDKNITRIDMLIGAAAIAPEFAARVQG